MNMGVSVLLLIVQTIGMKVIIETTGNKEKMKKLRLKLILIRSKDRKREKHTGNCTPKRTTKQMKAIAIWEEKQSEIIIYPRIQTKIDIE